MGNILPQLEVAYVESVYVDNKLPGMHNAGQVCIPQRRHGRSAACTSIYPTHTHTRALGIALLIQLLLDKYPSKRYTVTP